MCLELCFDLSLALEGIEPILMLGGSSLSRFERADIHMQFDYYRQEGEIPGHYLFECFPVNLISSCVQISLMQCKS